MWPVVVRRENELFSEKQRFSFFPQHLILMNRLRYCFWLVVVILSSLAAKAVGLSYKTRAERDAFHAGCDRASDGEERWYPKAKDANPRSSEGTRSS